MKQNFKHFIMPEAEDILPCFLGPNNEITAFHVHCNDKNLNDSRMAQILDVLLNTPRLVPLIKILYMRGNSLTKVPDQLVLFDRLRQIDLSNNNISSVQKGAVINSELVSLLGSIKQ